MMMMGEWWKWFLVILCAFMLLVNLGRQIKQWLYTINQARIGVEVSSSSCLDRESGSSASVVVNQASIGVEASSSSCLGQESSLSASVVDEERLAQFNVFLNHRGPDVKMTFISHLDAALQRRGCDPFLDFKSLVKGHHAFNSINDALSGVQVHVAVFTPRYAESKYCLNELCDMLASRKPIIPVFYKVMPEDLRFLEKVGGPYAKAFSHHLTRGRLQKVAEWKEALTEVANITGFTFNYNDNEEKLVREVASAVLKALPSLYSIPAAKYPVGLKSASAHVVDVLMKMGDHVGAVGICGTGGIGKTTLAREVFNQVQLRFESWCFLMDAKGSALMDLQRRMAECLLGIDDVKVLGDHACCIEMIQKKKVLIVVDDITKIVQFTSLLPELHRLAHGSRVIITSRDSSILQNIMRVLPQSQQELYSISGLNPLKSEELFIKHAFRKKKLNEVDVKFHDNVREVTNACGGLPLALEVIGGFLCDKKENLEYWHEAIKWLSMRKGISSKLRICYFGLGEEEKNVFLDIACTMLGCPQSTALRIWKSRGYYAITSALSSLKAKCLVKVYYDGTLTMHDLLRDMGRMIIKDEAGGKLERQSHVWDPITAKKILCRKQGKNNMLKSLSLIGSCLSNSHVANSFKRFQGLTYLLLDGCSLKGNFEDWSEELTWLQWRSFPDKELPKTLKVSNLVVLDLNNSKFLTCVWPLDCNKFIDLEVLNLNLCMSLTTLPPSFGNLSKLEELDMRNCTKLQSLCENFGSLGMLQVLVVSGCEGLTTLPPSFGNLLKSERLDMGDCTKLQSLCETLGLF